MALSAADFYAYSRATGAPYPEDPEERAEMAPEVLEFRRNQLRAPEQGPNLLETLGLGALAAGGLAGIGFGARRFLRGSAQKPVSVAAGITKKDLAKVATAPSVEPKQYVQPSKVVGQVQEVAVPTRRETAIPEATVDLPSPPQQERMVRRHGRMVPASSVQRTAAAIPEATVDVADKLIEKYRADYERAAPFEYGAELSRQSRIAKGNEALIDDLIGQVRSEPSTPSREFNVDQFLKENEGLYRRLVSAEDVKEKRVLGAEFFEQLRSGQYPERKAPSTVLPTRANQPGAFTDLTSIQDQLLNQARNQQINAVEAGEDQVAQRARRKTTSLLRSQTAETSPALQKLYDAGLDDFEINARINAFAQYNKPEFLDPNYNAATVGPENFARTLDVNAPEFDRSGRLIGGEYASGSQTLQLLKKEQEVEGTYNVPEFVTVPEGEIKRSAFASQQPRPVRTRSQNDEETWEPISEALTGLTGGVSTAAVPLMQSEQYQEAINNFRGYWDDQVRAHRAGEQSSITRPARRNRLVDSYDLDMPVRLRNVETQNEAGDLIKTTETVLYRDTLPQETVEAIERGEQMNLDVPFLVDKNRAIAVAEANPTVQNRLDAEQYKATGRALVRAHQKIVGPYADDQFMADLRETAYFQRAVNPEGQPDVTPGFGRGSQKGRLVGGVAEELVQEPVYNLYYAPHTTKAGNKILVNKTQVLDEKGNVGELGITDLNQLNQIGIAKDATGAELVVSPGQQLEYITTQPMSVKRPLKKGAPPVGQITRKGKYGQFTSDVYEAAETIVQAPLQVLDAKTGKTISGTGQIKRGELAGFLNGLRTATGVKDYAELGSLANQMLAEQKGITLPVLDSPTAFDFIEGVVGRPGSRPSRKSFVTVNQKTGDVYPLSREEAQQLGFAGGSVVEPSLSRKYVGPPSLDIRQSPKSMESWSRMGEGEADWEQYKDFGDETLGVANVGVLEPRRPGELQQRLSPATTGPGAELQALREQIAKIEPKETRFSSETLPYNLEVVTQQLMAQAGRRAGKRRNR
jgi:hypothetical protein